MFLPLTRNRFLYRSPDAAPGGPSGAETAPNAPAAATAEGAGSEAPAADAGGESPNPTPAKQKAGAPPAQPTRDADNAAYLRILEKAEKNESYQMSDAEAEVFGRVSERDDADIPKPGKKAKAKVEPEGDPDEGNDDGAAGDEKPAADEEGDDAPTGDEDDDAGVPAGLEAFVGKDSPFGAKTAKELPAKLKEFTAKFKEMQGRDGEHGRLKQRVENQTDFLRRFMAGDEKALQFAEQNLGYKRPGAQAPGQRPAAPKAKAGSQFLDDELAAHVEATVAQVRSEYEARLAKLEGRHQVLEADSATVEAQGQVMDEMTTLVEKYPDLAIKGGSLRELAKAYLSNPGLEKVDARFKNLAQIFHLAADKGLPSLEAAYALWRLQTLPQTVVEAERRGRESLAKNQPSRGLSDRQGSQGGQYQAYTDQDIQSMAEGRMDIPDEWQDQAGNLIESKLPKRLRDQFRKMVPNSAE
jgi:hypothetical protein